MLAPIDISHIETALTSPARWIELAIVAACFAAGWLLDRRLRLHSASAAEIVRVGLGSVNRLLLPLVALGLLVLASAAFRIWEPPFFLPIAVSLAGALAVIRLVVYAMRELFGTPSWLPASERAVSFTIWAIVFLQVIGVLPAVWTELDAMSIPVGTKQLSVFELLKGAFVVVLTIAGTLWLSGLVEQRLLHAARLDGNVRVVVGKSLRAVLLTVGTLIALQSVGIDLTLLTVFSGALGVGVGLGLQKLASNYISGFTILLDGSIKLGDLILVDNRLGFVAKVTARYVVVRSLDGVDAIVPNDTLVTTTVLNHSYSGSEIRLGIPIQVSFDTDVERALKLMEDVARAEPRVLRAPNAPAAVLVRVAESGYDLELGVWINDPENGQGGLRSAINLAILRAFSANQIRLPLRQREVHIVGTPATVANAPGTSGRPADSG